MGQRRRLLFVLNSKSTFLFFASLGRNSHGLFSSILKSYTLAGARKLTHTATHSVAAVRATAEENKMKHIAEATKMQRKSESIFNAVCV